MPAEDASYTRLPLSPSRQEDIEPLDVEGDDTKTGFRVQGSRSRGLSESSSWRLFVASCIVSLGLSAINLSTLSAWSTATALSLSFTQPTRLEPKRPNPYLGLENVVFEPGYCRSRETFPEAFHTYDASDGSDARITRVHAPDDAATLTFGGPVRAIADIYVPDHGLENCTLSLRRLRGVDTDSIQPAVDVDVYLRPSIDLAPSQPTTFLDTLTFAPGKESISRPFYCPSRSHIFVEWRCPAEDCLISMPLEGVTRMTSSKASLSKTGFRITQYEALRCIDE